MEEEMELKEAVINKEVISQKLRSICTMKYAARRLPIINWLPKYNLDYFVSDLIAGVTVGLLVIPQGIAYGDLAGLPVQYGLYTAFMGCFVYCIFGSVKQINFGPTAIVAIMINPYVQRGGPDYAVLLCLLSGLFLTFAAILKLGVLIDLVSVPVISGFITAASIVIATSQVKSLLGLKFHAEGFVEEWEMIIHHLGETRQWDCVLGIVCIVVLLMLKKLKECRFLQVKPHSNKFKRIAIGFVNLFINSRIIIVVFGTILLKHLSRPLATRHPGHVESGLPEITLPSFHIVVQNSTLTASQLMRDVGTSLVTIPLVSILESLSISKSFARGKTIDASQEMLALGITNILGAFVSSFPAAGSISRAAVNATSGVCTPFGGVWTGSLVLIALVLLAPYFAYIPKSALAAVIMSAVLFMTEFGEAVHIFKTKKIEFLTWLLTFVCCLFLGIEFGIVIGVVFNILLLLHHSARPKVVFTNLQHGQASYIVAKLDRSVQFPSVEYVRYVVTKTSRKNKIEAVVFDMSSIADIDFTAVKGLSALASDFSDLNMYMIFTNMGKRVKRILDLYGFPNLLQCPTLLNVPTFLEKMENDKQDSKPIAIDTECEEHWEHGQGITNVSFVS